MPFKSQPDTFLLNEMIGKPPLHGIDNNKYLLEWFAALETGNESLCRHRARYFLEKSAEKLASDIGVSDNRKKHLVSMFEPLDRLFVSAVSLRDKGEQIREHLSHTIRNYMFSQYILHRLSKEHFDRNQKLLGLAAIFHDLAYPIEKFKKAARVLSDAFFKDYLDTKGKFDVELVETENFLTVLDFVGNHDLPVFEYLYIWVVAPAIAGIGLFDSNHNISSTAMFIRSIYDKYGKHDTFWKDKEMDIAEICMAITFHDRKMNPFALPNGVKFSCVAKALRIADELQEWGRDEVENSYVSEVTIDEHPESDTLISLTITLKHISDEKKCQPHRFMADKLIGLLPVIGKSEKLKLTLIFPENIDPSHEPNKDNIVTAYGSYIFNSILNEKIGLTPAEIKRKINTKYKRGNRLQAVFSDNKMYLS